MSEKEKREKDLRELAISLRPYVYAAFNEARRAKASVCVIGVCTITSEETKIVCENLDQIVTSCTKVDSSFIPDKLCSQDCIWRRLKELLDEQ